MDRMKGSEKMSRLDDVKVKVLSEYSPTAWMRLTGARELSLELCGDTLWDLWFKPAPAVSCSSIPYLKLSEEEKIEAYESLLDQLKEAFEDFK